MSPDKTDSHKSKYHVLSSDIATVCQHMKSILEVKSHCLHKQSRRHNQETNLRSWKRTISNIFNLCASFKVRKLRTCEIKSQPALSHVSYCPFKLGFSLTSTIKCNSSTLKQATATSFNAPFMITFPSNAILYNSHSSKGSINNPTINT